VQELKAILCAVARDTSCSVRSCKCESEKLFYEQQQKLTAVLCAVASARIRSSSVHSSQCKTEKLFCAQRQVQELTEIEADVAMGWLRLVGSLKLQVSCA